MDTELMQHKMQISVFPVKFENPVLSHSS